MSPVARLPRLTHLQFLVLDQLRGGVQPGRVIRDALAARGVKRSGPAFYQMMARLEDAKLVKGWYVKKEVEGHTVKERWYKITPGGLRTWQQVLDFYRQQAESRGQMATGFLGA